MSPHFKKKLWISLGIVFASVIIAVVALYILIGDMNTSATKILADKTLIEQQTASLALYAQLKQQAPQAAPYQAAMDKVLPDQDELLDFSQWVDGLATTNQVSANVSFSENVQPPSGTAPGTAGFSMTVSGNINNIISFLSDIQKSSGYLVQLVSFNLTNQNSNPEVSAQGNLFFRQ